MNSLFEYLKDKPELTLIKSCVFHYEMEFIHPSMDGNGKMGRLWQTSILMNQYPLFEFLPFETLISKKQPTTKGKITPPNKGSDVKQFSGNQVNGIELYLVDFKI